MSVGLYTGACSHAPMCTLSVSVLPVDELLWVCVGCGGRTTDWHQTYALPLSAVHGRRQVTSFAWRHNCYQSWAIEQIRWNSMRLKYRTAVKRAYIAIDASKELVRPLPSRIIQRFEFVFGWVGSSAGWLFVSESWNVGDGWRVHKSTRQS